MRLVEPQLTENLVDRESMSRLRHVTTLLPASIAHFFGFESGLGVDFKGTDFAISLSAYGLDWLCASQRWPDVSDFVKVWHECLASGAATVWLEFDTSLASATSRPPSVFITLDRNEAEPIETPAAVFSPDLARCIAAFPQSVTKVQLGFMFSRPGAAVRLCALLMTYEETIEFLTAIAWPCSRDRVAAILAPYESRCDGFGVHVDLLDGIAASLGLEFLYRGKAQDRQPDTEKRWSALFERLIHDRLCTVEQWDGLARWVSQRTLTAPLVERLIARRFPSDSALLHGTLHTGLQHIKLSFGASGRIRAKAYFGAVLEPAL